MARMQRVSTNELREHLDEYLRAVEAGESVEVADDGHTIARLVPADEESNRKKAATLRELAAELAKLPPVTDVDAVTLLRESRDQR